MKPVVVIAFYVWLALTVAIVLGRLARWTAARQASKRRRRARALARQQAETLAVATPTSGSAPNTPLPNTAPPNTALPNTAPPNTAPPNTAPPSQPPTMAPVATEPMPDPAPETTRPVEERRAEERRAADRRVGDRRNGDRRARRREVPVPALAHAPNPTIPQLLAGIAIPPDLVPITPVGAPASDQSATLISRERPAYEVGTGIADELERLGYQLTPVGDAALLATRGDDILTVEIDPTPNQPDPNGKVRFPTANTSDVVVEFWVGSGPRPT